MSEWISVKERLPEISIHAPREGCDYNPQSDSGYPAISIHAPREGCDSFAVKVGDRVNSISIHAPREGCDD